MMKKQWRLLVIFLMGFALFGCSILSEPNFSIRITNNYSETVNNVMVGTVSFGSISPSTTTSYRSIEAGDHTLSGTTPSGGNLSGTVTLSGNGTHKWTMTITSSGSLSLSLDQ